MNKSIEIVENYAFGYFYKVLNIYIYNITKTQLLYNTSIPLVILLDTVWLEMVGVYFN